MSRRVVGVAAIVVGTFFSLQGVASGCGDKFVLLGRGALVTRSRYPSSVLIFMNPASRVPAADREFHVEATLKAAGHKTKVVESQADVEKALGSGKYDLVLADVADAREIRRRCETSASKPAVLPLLYKPTSEELATAEKEANCLVRPSKKAVDLLAVVDETMKDRSKGLAPNCPPVR